ncbi:MAG: 4-phytase, partial [Chloroflexi bacterium]|nr:4-phytase [Chloroflexota bacterium]
MRALRSATAHWTVRGILLVALALTGCAPGGPATSGQASGPGTEARNQRQLVIYVAAEPNSLAQRALAQRSASIRFAQRVFNAQGSLRDSRGIPEPELFASLPTLNSQDWQVFPDGTMQTTYTLRPNLTWHDGQPLTADDFAFSWRIYSNPVLGVASQLPFSSISDVTALDRQHFTVHWKQPYADADTLSEHNRELPALPQHVLGPALEQLPATGPEPFVNNAFWGAQFVGLGPFRVQQWELSSYIDAGRFDGYALGAPKVQRVQLRFSADQNVVMAALLAGEAHAATDSSIPNFPEVLMQQWPAGTVAQSPSSLRALNFQLRPELVNPRAILDVRVRQAIAHAVDRQEISDALYMGQGIFADTPILPNSELGAALDSSIPSYPLDLRASEQLMNQSGWSKGPDG